MKNVQRYTNGAAIVRMTRGDCPECGHRVRAHDGAGGPYGCTLTDNGVAARIAAFEADMREASR